VRGSSAGSKVPNRPLPPESVTTKICSSDSAVAPRITSQPASGKPAPLHQTNSGESFAPRPRIPPAITQGVSHAKWPKRLDIQTSIPIDFNSWR